MVLSQYKTVLQFHFFLLSNKIIIAAAAAAAFLNALLLPSFGSVKKEHKSANSENPT